MILLIGLLLPLSAEAATIYEWNLITGKPETNWDISKLENVTPTREGLRIESNTEGAIFISEHIPYSFDVLSIEALSPRPMEANFLWKNFQAAADSYIKQPFLIQGKMANIDLTTHDYWTSGTPRIGFQFPAGTQVVLQKIRFIRWNMFEKAWHSVHSFWHFDTMQMHATNYLWGPHIVTNPIAMQIIHDRNPPYGARPLYWIIALLLLSLPVGYFFQLRLRTRFTPFIVLTVFFWCLLDVRMGAELLSYAQNDWTQYLLPPSQEKTFREFESLHHTAIEARKLIDDDRFLLIAPPYSAVYNTFRYHTYPIHPQTVPDGQKFALVFERRDVRFHEGILENRDGTIYGSGTLVKQINPTSYLIELQ